MSLTLTPPSPHSRLLFAYYILQGILHNIYISIGIGRGIGIGIGIGIGWYIKKPMYLLFIWGNFFGPKWHERRAQKCLDF